MERPAQRTGALEGRQRRRAGLEDLVAVGQHRTAARLHQRVAARAVRGGIAGAGISFKRIAARAIAWLRVALDQRHPELAADQVEQRRRQRR